MSDSIVMLVILGRLDLSPDTNARPQQVQGVRKGANFQVFLPFN